MKPRLTFQEKGHQYFLDGKKIPSLTQVINMWFGPWDSWNYQKNIILNYLYKQRKEIVVPGSFVDNEIIRFEGEKAAAEKGGRIHKALELEIKKILDPKTLIGEKEDLTGYVKQFNNFLIDHKLDTGEKTHPEIRKYITWNNLACGMRLDLLFKQSMVVIEFKTGAVPQPGRFGYTRDQMQLNTQLNACESKRKPVSKWTGFLVYLKEDRYKAIKTKFQYSMWADFLSALKCWYNQRGRDA